MTYIEDLQIKMCAFQASFYNAKQLIEKELKTLKRVEKICFLKGACFDKEFIITHKTHDEIREYFNRILDILDVGGDENA